MTRNASQGKDLPPLRFNALPEPLVVELGEHTGWLAFESALRERDDFPATVPMEMT